MEENRLRGLGLESISGAELQVRGGFSWFRAAKKLAKAALAVMKFIDEYGDDIEQGFKRGWNSF